MRRARADWRLAGTRIWLYWMPILRKTSLRLLASASPYERGERSTMRNRREYGRRSPLSEPVHVRAAQRADFPQWSELWDGYNTFYGRAGETALAPEVTRMTWSRFFDAYEPMHALVAEGAGRVVGLGVFLYHRSTIQIPPTCYLADLFTADAVRGQGVGLVYRHSV